MFQTTKEKAVTGHTSRLCMALVALALTVGCTDAPATAVGGDAVAEQEYAALQSRFADLDAQRDRLGEQAYAGAYRALADDVREWHERTGLLSTELRTALGTDKECVELTAASAAMDDGRGPGCAPCPAWPSNAPPGYICWLVKETCDPSGRSCQYHCVPLVLPRWW